MGGVPDRTDGVMAEYYSSEDVKDFIRSYRHSTDVVFHMEKHINEIPADDVRPVVMGKWIQDCDYHFRCSACGDRWTVSNGHPLDVTNGWNFCPNCGADMREER